MSTSTRRAIVAELKAAGAVLHRQGRHETWRLPNGARVVISRSPSDGRAIQNARAALRRAVGR